MWWRGRSTAAAERGRRAELLRLEILDTPREESFDEIVRIAARVLATPIASITLIDGERQWFKAVHGIDLVETPRAASFCQHTIAGPEVLVVPDTLRDVRFRGSPYVVGDPGIRFYAGAPIVTRAGIALGAVCAIDIVPRPAPSTEALGVLHELAGRTGTLMERRLLDQRQDYSWPAFG